MAKRRSQSEPISKLREFIRGGGSLTDAVRQIPELTDEHFRQYLEEEAQAARLLADGAAAKSKPGPGKAKPKKPGPDASAPTTPPQPPARVSGSLDPGLGSGGTTLGNRLRRRLAAAPQTLGSPVAPGAPTN